MRIRYLSPSRREYADALFWYQHQRAGLGRELANEIQVAVNHTRSNPMSGEAVEAGCRRLPVKRFPYSIIFRFDEANQEVVIIAIAHDSRCPGYWCNRVKEA